MKDEYGVREIPCATQARISHRRFTLLAACHILQDGFVVLPAVKNPED